MPRVRMPWAAPVDRVPMVQTVARVAHSSRIPDELRERFERAAAGGNDRALVDALLDVVILPPGQALTRLRAAFDSPDADRTAVAKGLAWFGDTSGTHIVRRL